MSGLLAMQKLGALIRSKVFDDFDLWQTWELKNQR